MGCPQKIDELCFRYQKATLLATPQRPSACKITQLMINYSMQMAG